MLLIDITITTNVIMTAVATAYTTMRCRAKMQTSLVKVGSQASSVRRLKSGQWYVKEEVGVDGSEAGVYRG